MTAWKHIAISTVVVAVIDLMARAAGLSFWEAVARLMVVGGALGIHHVWAAEAEEEKI